MPASATDARARDPAPAEPPEHLRREPVRRFSRHGSILSGVKASGKPVTVQCIGGIACLAIFDFGGRKYSLPQQIRLARRRAARRGGAIFSGDWRVRLRGPNGRKAHSAAQLKTDLSVKLNCWSIVTKDVKKGYVTPLMYRHRYGTDECGRQSLTVDRRAKRTPLAG